MESKKCVHNEFFDNDNLQGYYCTFTGNECNCPPCRIYQEVEDWDSPIWKEIKKINNKYEEYFYDRSNGV